MTDTALSWYWAKEGRTRLRLVLEGGTQLRYKGRERVSPAEQLTGTATYLPLLLYAVGFREYLNVKRSAHTSEMKVPIYR